MSPPRLRRRHAAAAVMALALTCAMAPAVLAEPPVPGALRPKSIDAPSASIAPSAIPSTLPQPSPSQTAVPTSPAPAPIGLLRPVAPTTETPSKGTFGVEAAGVGQPNEGGLPTVTPAEPTPSPEPTATAIEFPAFSPAIGAVRGWIEGRRLLLDVPIRSQFDGTEYQSSNCGPTSLAMVLDAYGVSSKTFQVRNLANRLQGSYERDDGIALDYLAWIAREAGLRTLGLGDERGYHRWSYEEIHDHVRRGHPVITLVKLRDLPDHAGTGSVADHYVVVVGIEEDKLLINDPAMPAALGFRRPLSREQLERAWADSSMPGHAVAFAATEALQELILPDPSEATAPSPDLAGQIDALVHPPGVDPAPPPEGIPGMLEALQAERRLREVSQRPTMPDLTYEVQDAPPVLESVVPQTEVAPIEPAGQAPAESPLSERRPVAPLADPPWRRWALATLLAALALLVHLIGRTTPRMAKIAIEPTAP